MLGFMCLIYLVFVVCECSLVEDGSVDISGEYCSFLQKHWTCPQCGQSLIVTLGEKLHHEQQCMGGETGKGVGQEGEQGERDEDRRLEALRKPYHCQTCGQDFKFTTAEILKHKKACNS